MKQFRQIAVLLLAAALLATLTAFGAENASVVTLTGDAVRVQLLSDTVIRVEVKDENGFLDSATLVAAGRADFPGVAATTRTEGDNLIAETDRYVVTLAKGKALTADAVTVAAVPAVTTVADAAPAARVRAAEAPATVLPAATTAAAPATAARAPACPPASLRMPRATPQPSRWHPRPPSASTTVTISPSVRSSFKQQC